MAELSVKIIHAIPENGFDPLLSESLSEGHSCIERFKLEWVNGSNRFNGQGEFYLAGYIDDQLAGLGGLSIDPYAQADHVGRVRHLYVLNQYRRNGVASALMRRIVDGAIGQFNTLHLRIPKNGSVADSFYLSWGFERVLNDEFCTHKLELRRIKAPIAV